MLGRGQREPSVPDVVGRAELVHVLEEGQVAEGTGGRLKSKDTVSVGVLIKQFGKTHYEWRIMF